jgi:copper chaperone CopZ
MRTAHLTIDGMHAVHAVRAVYTAFAGVPGVVRADVALGRATVEHDGSATRAALEEAVALAGFSVRAFREERSLPTI